MERMSVKEYARKHKLSLFQVIKKINTGELTSEMVEENGMKVQYVLVEEVKSSTPEERKNEVTEKGSNPSKPAANPFEEKLLLELQSLRAEVKALRTLVEKCCNNS